MQASILTVGDELLIGQVLNTNVQWISEKLTDLNIAVSQHLTAGDRHLEIQNALLYLKPKSDVIIISGGLGPTHDDLTLEVLANFTGNVLEYDPDWIEKVEAFFKARNRTMTENNKKQGLLIKNAIRIDNDCGTAAGQHLHHQGTEIFVLPGVPHEMKSMMERYVLPTLQKLNQNQNEKILKKTLITTGIGESALAERIDGTVKKIQSLNQFSLAFLPSSTVVRLRLQMRAQNANDETLFESLVKELQAGCGQDFLGFDPTSLEEVVVKTLTQKNQTLALAESCTGGLIAHRVTQIPGASVVFKGAIVSYQEEIKNQELNIEPSLLKEQGVVSEAVAIQMAENVRKKWNTTYSVATTGFLGPQGDAFAPAGTVWIAVAHESGTITRRFQFETHRERSKERASQSALDLLRRTL